MRWLNVKTSVIYERTGESKNLDVVAFRPAENVSELHRIRFWGPFGVLGRYPQLVDYLLQRLTHVCPAKKTLARAYADITTKAPQLTKSGDFR